MTLQRGIKLPSKRQLGVLVLLNYSTDLWCTFRPLAPGPLVYLRDWPVKPLRTLKALAKDRKAQLKPPENHILREKRKTNELLKQNLKTQKKEVSFGLFVCFFLCFFVCLVGWLLLPKVLGLERLGHLGRWQNLLRWVQGGAFLK